jgi:hypothetical protein
MTAQLTGRPLRARRGVVAANVCARNAAMCDKSGCEWCMGGVGRQAPLHTSQKRGKGGEVACGGGGAGGGGVALERGLVGSEGVDVDDNGYARL